jgi:oxalate decarboxylase/phosphoglucose isomerase-like protein (cupin superfamily)
VGASAAGALSLLEAEEPPGFGPPVHIHRDAAEAFYVVAGEYIIYVREEEFRCPAGSFIYIPAGIPHGFRVGAEPSRKLNLYTPAAMVGYFDELSAALARGEVDPDALAEIAERHGMEVVGAVPDGYV